MHLIHIYWEPVVCQPCAGTWGMQSYLKTCLGELVWSPTGERDVFLKNALEVPCETWYSRGFPNYTVHRRPREGWYRFCLGAQETFGWRGYPDSSDREGASRWEMKSLRMLKSRVSSGVKVLQKNLNWFQNQVHGRATLLPLIGDPDLAFLGSSESPFLKKLSGLLTRFRNHCFRQCSPTEGMLNRKRT